MAVPSTARPPLPATLPVLPASVPTALKEHPNWATWRWAWNADKGEWKKLPISPRTGGAASSTDPATWTTFSRALTCARDNEHAGLLFALTEEANLIAVDLDHCVADGVPARWATALVTRFGSYAERSPRGEGLHIFVTGQLPKGRRKRHPVEIYQTGRFMSVTGQRLDGACAEPIDAPDAVAWLLAKLGPSGPDVEAHPIVVTPVPNLEQRLREADLSDELRALLDYPSWGRYKSASEADAAVACALIRAGFSEGETLSILENSPRGVDAFARKGTARHGEYYWQTTVASAAARVGSVRPVFGGLRGVFPTFKNGHVVGL